MCSSQVFLTFAAVFENFQVIDWFAFCWKVGLVGVFAYSLFLVFRCAKFVGLFWFSLLYTSVFRRLVVSRSFWLNSWSALYTLLIYEIFTHSSKKNKKIKSESLPKDSVELQLQVKA